ncbi:MAG: protein kinase, partial [bacterium]
MIGKTISHYKILEKLGQGGMGIVYKAEDTKLKRTVALKFLSPHALGGSEEEKKRFVHEARAAAALHHPNICTVYEIDEVEEQRFIAMAYLDGPSLKEKIASGPLRLEEVLEIAIQIAQGLHDAHEQGIIHRDIKSSNVMLTSKGQAILMDFGLAKLKGGTLLTKEGTTLGTVSYMSPEQAQGATTDQRSDIWSFGVMLYEMITGLYPFKGDYEQAVIYSIMNEEPEPITGLRTGVPMELERIVNKAMAKNPEERYQHVDELIADLKSLRKSMETGAVAGLAGTRQQRPETVAIPLWAKQFKKPWPIVTASLVVVLAVLAALLYFRNQGAVFKPEPKMLVVFPFRASGPEAGSLGEGVADLLGAALDGTGEIHVADPLAMWRPLRQGHGELLRVPELPEALELAQREAARSVLLGSLTAVGGRVEISARLYDVNGTLKTTLRASENVENLSKAINRLAIDVLAKIWQRDILPTVPVIEKFATDSFDALKAYIEAKSLKQRGLYEQAEESIRRAIAIDSTFALAHMELFDIRSWLLFLNAQPFIGLREIIDRAMKYRERLTPRNRLRVEAARALDDTDGARAAILLERILDIDPLDVDALQKLAFTYSRDGWQMGKGIAEIIVAYDRLLEVDSASVVGNIARAWLGIWTEEADAIQRGIARLRSLDTTRAFVQARLGVFRTLEAAPSQRSLILRELAGRPFPVVTTVIRDLRAIQPQLAERYIEMLMTEFRPISVQQLGLQARPSLWFAQGRIAANDSVIATGVLDGIRQALNRYFVTTSLARVGDRKATERAVNELMAYAPVDSFEAFFWTKNVWATGWAVAVYHATFGDTAEARIWQRALEKLPAGGTPLDYRGSLSADIEARIAVRRGDLETAERAARRAYELWGIHSGYFSPSHPEPAMRFHLAEILYANGTIEQAASLYRSLCPPHTWMGFYTARAAFELGRIEENRDHKDEARRYYLLAANLWEQGDSAVVGSWYRHAQDGL